MAGQPIIRQRETWFVTNVSRNDIIIKDIPSIPIIKPGKRIDLLVYTSLSTAQSSTVIGAYIAKGWLDSEEYLHTHDDKSDVEHNHSHNQLEGLNQGDYIHLTSSEKSEFTTLTDGSNADDLHTHEGTGGKSKHNELEDIQGGNEDDYYHLKKTQHDALTDGSDADSLHTHNGKADASHTHPLSDVTDVTATSSEINKALDGIGDTVTATNLNRLTNNSNADSLHTHSGTGGATDHDDLTNVTANQHHAQLHSIASHNDTTATGTELDTLTGGVNADALHSHSASNISILDSGGYYTGTEAETALQEIGLILTSLAPPSPPFLDDRGASTGINLETTGTNAYITWASSSLIGYADIDGIGLNSPVNTAVGVDESFTVSNDRGGVINATTNMTGYLNDDVAADTASPTPAYEAKAFSQGDTSVENLLILELNGVELASQNIDLTNPAAQNTSTGTDSGFNISEEKTVKFPNGGDFASYYRTGSWKVDYTDMNNGWNYVRVLQKINGVYTSTNYSSWVVDDDVTDTAYSGANLDTLAMTGSSFLSGVEYNTAGTAKYDILIDNAFRNTYQTGDIITFTCANGYIAAQSLGISGGIQSLQKNISNANFVVSAGRKLNATISAQTSVARTFNSNESNDPGGLDSISGLLMDDQISGASGETDTAESFTSEGYRQQSTLSLTDNTSYASGPGNGPAIWDSEINIVTGGAGYNDGLLQYNGALRYPTQGALSGDFNSVTNGPSPNVDYSSASGERVYLRYFYVGTGKQNFTFTINGSTTTFVAAGTSLSGQEVTLEMLAPNTTQDGVSTIEFKDCFSNYTDNDAIGCYTSGSKIINTSNWTCTLGTRSTATSDNSIVIRITASASWTGYISDISVGAS